MHDAQLRREHSAQLKVMQYAYAPIVKITSPRHLIRRENLQRLLQWVVDVLKEDEQWLAESARTQKTHLSAMKSGKRGVGDDLAARFDRIGVTHLALDAGWFDRSPVVAQSVSHDVQIIPPKTSDIPMLAWRIKSMKPTEKSALPAIFRVSAPDDAMADRVHRGWTLEFDSRLEARQDDGVLVEDAENNWFFRLYSAGQGEHFAALPLNRNYQPMDSQKHGLRVLGVLVGVPSRWT